MTHLRRTAVHAAKLAKRHGEISSALAKCCGMAKAAKAEAKLDPDALLAALLSLVGSFDGLQSEGEDYSDHCAKAADEETEKTAQDRLKKRDGDGAAIQPGERIQPPPGCVPIPRGAKTIPAVAPAVPLELEKVFSTSDETILKQ